jgi:Bacterial Ig-like domain (group 2)
MRRAILRTLSIILAMLFFFTGCSGVQVNPITTTASNAITTAATATVSTGSTTNITTTPSTTVAVMTTQTAYSSTTTSESVAISSQIPPVTTAPKTTQISGPKAADLEITADYYKLWKTWTITPAVNVIISSGSKVATSPSNCKWSSSNDKIASVDDSGLITALAGGTVDITGTYQGISKTITFNVVEPVLNPVEESIDPYLSTPMQNYINEMPVVIIRYLPTSDGINLDTAYAPDYWSLNQVSLSSMKSSLDQSDKLTKFMLEEGSKFHGYKDPDARPSLGYKIVKIITVYEPPPPGKFFYMQGDRKVFYVDKIAIFARFGLSSYIEANDVKEVWLNFGYVTPAYPSYNPAINGPESMIDLVESNMSSPTTGDISNSYRVSDDLPILNHTYTVYEYNIRRTASENVENHMHQLESLYSYINNQLFWTDCAGFANNKITAPARCGWTHYPPNGTSDYDWANKTLVSSDIEDWTPDNTGQRTMVNCDTWYSIPRNWPVSGFVPQYSETWFLFLMQNWPGYNNQIHYGSNTMTNWWEFTADWDKAVKSHEGLFTPTTAH